MTRQGRAVHVQHVMMATIMYHAMALDPPHWAIKALGKICRGYMWCGRRDAQGGHCLIAWSKVTRAKELGGLGISDLQRLNMALRVRWLWLKKVAPDKAWASLPIQSSEGVKALYSLAMSTEIGNGSSTLFWEDRWLFGQRIQDLSPLIFGMVPKRISNKRTSK